MKPQTAAEECKTQLSDGLYFVRQAMRHRRCAKTLLQGWRVRFDRRSDELAKYFREMGATEEEVAFAVGLLCVPET